MSTGLGLVAEQIRLVSGLALRDHQLDALAVALERVAPVLGPAQVAVALQAGDEELLGRVLDEVTVKETSFFRDPGQLESIDWPGLADMAARRGAGPLVAWSAGCATGEEAYTLAIAACEALGPEMSLRVVGTDVSPVALRTACVGVYRERSLRNLTPERRERWLYPTDGGDGVVEELRVVVEFRRHNLVRDEFPPAGLPLCHLVVCRNVFIYFEAKTVDSVLRSLEVALAPGGRLVLGAADALAGMFHTPFVFTPPNEPARSTPRGQPSTRLAAIPLAATPIDRAAQTAERLLVAAVDAAGRGDTATAQRLAAEVLANDPFHADAHFVQGVIALESGDAPVAQRALRAALYADPTFGIAAFMLGRADDAAGEGAHARRNYERALRLLNGEDKRHDYLLAQVEIDDVISACEARLAAT